MTSREDTIDRAVLSGFRKTWKAWRLHMRAALLRGEPTVLELKAILKAWDRATRDRK